MKSSLFLPHKIEVFLYCFQTTTRQCLAADKVYLERVIDVERWCDRWCWGRKKRRSDRYSCPRTGGDDSDRFTPLLFSSRFSVLTSRLWQLTWRHESDDDILWPLPCLTHYFDTSCPDGMSGFMLTNLERPLLFSILLCAQSLFKLFRQGRRQKGFLTWGLWREK